MFLFSGIILTSVCGLSRRGKLLVREGQGPAGLREAEHGGLHTGCTRVGSSAHSGHLCMWLWPGLHPPPLLLLSLVSSHISSSGSGPLSHSHLGFHPHLCLPVPLLLPLRVLLTPPSANPAVPARLRQPEQVRDEGGKPLCGCLCSHLKPPSPMGDQCPAFQREASPCSRGLRTRAGKASCHRPPTHPKQEASGSSKKLLCYPHSRSLRYSAPPPLPRRAS